MFKLLLRLTVIGLFSFQLFSCAKDHYIPIDPEPNGIENLRSAIRGKWLIDTSAVTNLPEGSFLEFFWTDTTYIQGLEHGPRTTKYEITSPTSIKLPGVGGLENIAFSGNKMSFTRLHLNGQVLEHRTATKAPHVDSTGLWNYLLYRTWSVLPVENGGDSFGKLGQLTSLFFSSQGTLISRYERYRAGTYLNWRWDDSQPKRLVYWENYQGIKPDDYITIKTVAGDTLKITHSSTQWGVKNFTLIPRKNFAD